MNALVLVGIGVIGVLVFYGQQLTESIGVEDDTMPSWKSFDPLFRKYGTEFGVPWTWLKAIALNESSLGSAKSVMRGLKVPTDVEGSKSSDGKSWGLMQVTLTTAKEMDPAATSEKLNNPEYSIKLAAKYLKNLSSQFSKIESRYLEWVIKSYNQGPGNTRREKAGTSQGFAHEYWARFQRNLERVEANQ